MISTEKILRAICILQIFGSARESAVASCNFLFLHLAFCIFLQIELRAFAICKNKILHFAFFKDDFYWVVSIMETNFNSVPRRAICKKSILHFASCNFLQYYQLASLQGAKTRSCILHFAFFCKYAIVQKLSANIDFLQFARSFCIFSQFCKKVMISKYPPLAQTPLRSAYFLKLRSTAPLRSTKVFGYIAGLHFIFLKKLPKHRARASGVMSERFGPF